MSVRLEPMSGARYLAWVPETVSGFAEQMVAADVLPAREARARAEQEFDALLPEGVHTPGHHLWSAYVDDTEVGYLWVALRAGLEAVVAFVVDIAVVPSRHGQGLGRDLLLAVLMDIRLPGMNGIEATRRVRRDHPDARVLVVTAYDDEEYVRSALEAGASGHLSKAARGRELVDAIRVVAAGGTVVEPIALTHLLERTGARSWGGTRLTEREQSVLELLVAGLHNKEVAVRLAISRRTVDRHCDNIYAKLGVGSRTEAVVRAISARLVTVPDERH